MLGATFTDIAIWVFYPFNGAAKAKLEIINVSLGKIGEHIGDWEHLTLRVSNFNGELTSVFFSQHSAGVWVSAPELEFQGGNKPVTYSALRSHSFGGTESLNTQNYNFKLNSPSDQYQTKPRTKKKLLRYPSYPQFSQQRN